MTIKKLTVIAAAGAALLAGAIGISMSLISPREMEMEVSQTPVEQGEDTANADDSKTLGDMENIPLYYDETEKLLLPLRNVMEGLGGSVTWNKDTKMTEVDYRGRTLALQAGNRQAVLNGYEVTLPEAAEIINGCLYVEETLQTKDNTVPVMAVNVLTGQKDGRSYEIEVPVIVGLNDSKYEKNLNESFLQDMQAYADAFVATEAVEDVDGQLKLQVKTGMCNKDFLSIWWEGTKDGMPVNFAKNFDLLGQKTVTLVDMLKESSLEKAKSAAGEGWTEDRFYLTEEGGLALMKGSNEDSRNVYYWTTEGEQPEWKGTYQSLFRKKE